MTAYAEILKSPIGAKGTKIIEAGDRLEEHEHFSERLIENYEHETDMTCDGSTDTTVTLEVSHG